MSRRISGAVKWIVSVVALAVAGALAVSFIPTFFGYESSIVTSGSMGRANPVGSVAITRMVEPGGIRKGDVVTFQSAAGTRITHRVIKVTREEGQIVLTTKGDANRRVDPEPVRLASGRIAKVQWSVPYAGYVVKYARTPVGGLLLFAVPILGLTVDKRSKRTRTTMPVVQQEGISTSPRLDTALELACPHCGAGVEFGLVPSSPALQPVQRAG